MDWEWYCIFRNLDDWEWYSTVYLEDRWKLGIIGRLPSNNTCKFKGNTSLHFCRWGEGVV